MKWHDDNHSMSEINVTPLVDVMLVLLVIFIITVPVMRLSLSVNLPNQEAPRVEHRIENVHIELKKDGLIRLGDEVMTASQLKIALIGLAKQTPQPPVFLNADKDCRYEAVIELIAMISESGLKKLGFVTQNTKPQM